ncbi:MAG: gliding motility-associated C-terminal domain-containing protein, partial [Flavobacteriales bacterium]|nr:gliding motility-associated C-terminal domain-containing protein [Flavobacteriales bacterium]
NNQIAEIIEDNNEDSAEVTLLIFPEIIGLINLEICDDVGVETFDLTESTQQIDPDNDLTFHLSEMDAEDNINPIPDPENFENTQNPQTIFVRVANTSCYNVESFTVEVIICPLPDATIAITNELNACRQRNLFIAYSVYNLLGTAPLPAQTPIALYVDGILTATTATQSVIPIGGEIQQSIEIAISDATPDVFELLLVVDDTGDSTGIVEELDETNNNFTITVTFQSIPEIPSLSDLKLCNEGFGLASFNLTLQEEIVSVNPGDAINYFTTFEDALENTNPIESPFQYQSISNPQTIYVRLENEICFSMTHFLILTEDCKPFIPQGFSPNNDTINDFFEISGLLNIFPNHELFIYSRNGNIIFKGNNETGFWNGDANAGILYDGPVPAGLYYYVLNLNHPDFKIFTGWVYLNK